MTIFDEILFVSDTKFQTHNIAQKLCISPHKSKILQFKAVNFCIIVFEIIMMANFIYVYGNFNSSV